jgi:predicted small secreted protein|tara:strand:- start:28396 stop:28599 length:204 start_codon:yes stop_codon:yes gene_type:complete
MRVEAQELASLRDFSIFTTARSMTMSRTIALIFASFFTLAALSGCNTVDGAGQDVEHAGEAVQDAAQ